MYIKNFKYEFDIILFLDINFLHDSNTFLEYQKTKNQKTACTSD